MPPENETRNIERILEDILFCHQEGSLALPVYGMLTEYLGWDGPIQMCAGADHLIRYKSRAGTHTKPDKYLICESTGAKALAEFKVSRRGRTPKQVLNQVQKYHRGSDLPVVLISSWRWDKEEHFPKALIESFGLIEGQTFFYHNCSFQDAIDVARSGVAKRESIEHANFVKDGDAYILVSEGTSANGVLGFAWSTKYRDRCLPIRGLLDGLNPLEVGPFPYGTKKNADFLSRLARGGASIESFNGTFAGELVKAGLVDGEWEVLWPHRKLLDLHSLQKLR